MINDYQMIALFRLRCGTAIPTFEPQFWHCIRSAITHYTLSELWCQCPNCGSNVGIAVPHRNLNNAIIYIVIDHCLCDFITISSLNRNSDIWTAILTFDQGRQKWPLLTPKKSKYEGQKKRHSPNPCWHGLFAKKRVQIGLIWPPWPHLYFTPAYRGSPPCTLSQHPDNRETGYSNVLG